MVFKILKTLLDRHPPNMSETQILVLSISGSHLLTKANPLEKCLLRVQGLKRQSWLSFGSELGSGASSSRRTWKLGGNAHSRGPPQTSPTRISGGWAQQVVPGSSPGEFGVKFEDHSSGGIVFKL